MEEMMTTWRHSRVKRNISSLFSICQTLMADRRTLPLLRPSLPRPSIFLSFSNLHLRRLRNPKSPLSRSHFLYLSSSRSTVASVKVIPLTRRRFSFKINAVSENSGGHRPTERRKRERKRQELWEELFGDNVDDDNDRGRGDGRGNSDLWKILEEIVDNVWILKAFRSYGYLLPFILLSFLISTGLQAFLVSLAIAIAPSLLFYAFKKLIGREDKHKRTTTANQFGIDEEEELEMRSSRVRYNSSSVSRGSARVASRFGGWDEIADGLETEKQRVEPKRKPMRKRKRVRREAEPLLLRLLVSFTNMIK